MPEDKLFTPSIQKTAYLKLNEEELKRVSAFTEWKQGGFLDDFTSVLDLGSDASRYVKTWIEKSHPIIPALQLVLPDGKTIYIPPDNDYFLAETVKSLTNSELDDLVDAISKQRSISHVSPSSILAYILIGKTKTSARFVDCQCPDPPYSYFDKLYASKNNISEEEAHRINSPTSARYEIHNCPVLLLDRKSYLNCISPHAFNPYQTISAYASDPLVNDSVTFPFNFWQASAVSSERLQKDETILILRQKLSSLGVDLSNHLSYRLDWLTQKSEGLPIDWAQIRVQARNQAKEKLSKQNEHWNQVVRYVLKGDFSTEEFDQEKKATMESFKVALELGKKLQTPDLGLVSLDLKIPLKAEFIPASTK